MQKCQIWFDAFWGNSYQGIAVLLVKEFKKIISKTTFSSMSRYQSRYFQNILFQEHPTRI